MLWIDKNYARFVRYICCFVVVFGAEVISDCQHPAGLTQKLLSFKPRYRKMVARSNIRESLASEFRVKKYKFGKN